MLKPLRKFFPSVVTGTVVTAIGLSLIGVGINSLGGGNNNKDLGDPVNLVIGFAVKAVYDPEYERDTQTLAALRAKTDAEGEKVDKDLLARYKTIKQHCTPPMAKLVDGQCSGCFMSLPSATLRKMASGDGIVECDNCGRILYEEK